MYGFNLRKPIVDLNLCCSVLAITDILWIVLRQLPDKIYLLIDVSIYSILLVLFTSLFGLYAVDSSGVVIKRKWIKKLAFWILPAFVTLVSILKFNTEELFYAGEDGIVHFGTFFEQIILLALAELVIAIIISVVRIVKLKNENNTLQASFLKISVTGIIIYLLTGIIQSLLMGSGDTENSATVCMALALVYMTTAGNSMTLKEKAKTEARIGAELEAASKIQNSMVPDGNPKLDIPQIELCASMDTAIEVGGDFYDYYKLDDDHFAVIIADVSGKGVPAAMFMAVSETMFKVVARYSLSAGEIMAGVNDILCDKNDEGYFVTVWLGILEISTGRMKCANAGHTYPVVVKNGEATYFKDKHDIFCGGFPGAVYPEYEIQMEPGDEIFVYTDGIPEAHNQDGKMFEEQRLLEAVNEAKDMSLNEQIKYIRGKVNDFQGAAPQFDDITMLALKYLG